MSAVIKCKTFLSEHKKAFKLISIIVCLPILSTVLNLVLSTLFELGVYTGTFIRFLYHIVVY